MSDEIKYKNDEDLPLCSPLFYQRVDTSGNLAQTYDMGSGFSDYCERFGTDIYPTISDSNDPLTFVSSGSNQGQPITFSKVSKNGEMNYIPNLTEQNNMRVLKTKWKIDDINGQCPTDGGGDCRITWHTAGNNKDQCQAFDSPGGGTYTKDNEGNFYRCKFENNKCVRDVKCRPPDIKDARVAITDNFNNLKVMGKQGAYADPNTHPFFSHKIVPEQDRKNINQWFRKNLHSDIKYNNENGNPISITSNGFAAKSTDINEVISPDGGWGTLTLWDTKS